VKLEKKDVIAMTVISALFSFVTFYPATSGYPVHQWYSEYLHWFRDWKF